MSEAGRGSWRSGFLAACLLLAWTAAATCLAETTVPGVPRFAIESITVEGLRHGSSKIVVAASLLQPGREYDEAELRQAVHRIERLPFVLAADFALRKGSVRNTFELVITVTETSSFFLSADLEIPVGHSRSALIAKPTAGARVFFGGYSEVSATANTWISTVRGGVRDIFAQVSYTHHNLFSRSVAGTVTLTYYRPAGGGYGTRSGIDARLVVPLSGDHAIRLDVANERSEGFACESGASCDGDSGYYKGTLDWLVDDTDDPFTPRQGTRVSAGGSYQKSWTQFNWGQQDDPPDESFMGRDLHIDAERFFPMGRAQALGIGASYSYSSGELRNSPAKWLDHSSRASQVVLRAAHTVKLWQPTDRESFTQVWMESTAQLQRYRSWGDWFGRHSSTYSDSLDLTTALAARGRWGTLRFTLSYDKSLRSGS